MYSSSLVVNFGSGIDMIELELSWLAEEEDGLEKVLARKGGVNPSEDHT